MLSHTHLLGYTLIYVKKSEKISSLTNRSLPSFCFGFIALTSNSDKSWSFPARAKLAKLSRSLNRSSRKFSLIFIYVMNGTAIYIVVRMQHSVYYFNVLYACVARSAGWRKNSLISHRKLRTPEIFSQGAIISD